MLVVVTLAFCVSGMVLDASCRDPTPPQYYIPVPKPSAPGFTLNYVDRSYDVPSTTTSSTDPYTGEVTTHTTPGRHVTNFVIDVKIKNQDFPATISGNTSFMKYSVSIKGHYEPDEEWTTVQTVEVNETLGYTTVSIPANPYPVGGIVDIRVSATLGYTSAGFDWIIPTTYTRSESSDWTNHSLTIPDLTLTTPVHTDLTSATPVPTAPEYSLIVMLPLLAAIPFTIAVIQKKKHLAKV